MSETVQENIFKLLRQGMKDNEINCFRCGVCCRNGASMGLEEAELISKSTGMPLEDFVESSSPANYYGADRWLDELENYRTKRTDRGCIFLEAVPETNEVRCSIHTVRCPACRGYAPALDREACQTGLKRMWQITVTPDFTLEGNDESLKKFYDFLRSIVEDNG